MNEICRSDVTKLRSRGVLTFPEEHVAQAVCLQLTTESVERGSVRRNSEET